MQQNAVLSLMVKKLSVIFYSIFKIFLVLNILLLGSTLYFSRSTGGTFLFLVFFLNYWIMMMVFCLLSMYIKLFLCMTQVDSLGEDPSWVYSVIFFPLMTEENEEDFLQFVAQQSMDQDSQTTTQPPTTEELAHLEARWKTVMTDQEVAETLAPEPCLICSNPYSHEYPSQKGCVVLDCCPTLFHKKCVLEWFHFNGHPDQTDTDKSLVSCPSCRHVFSVVA
jgi:hypothetical protein